MKTSFVLGMLLTLTTSSSAFASCPSKLPGTFQQALDSWMAAQTIPAGGMCVVALKANGQRAVSCRGDQAPGKSANTQTLFQIGSVTKSFTGTLLARRVMEGSVGMSQRIWPYLPTSYQQTTNPVTFEQLATHRSGLPKNESAMSGNTNPNPAYGVFYDYYNCFNDPTCFIPSQGYEYSNFGASVLGYTLAYDDGYNGDWPEDIEDAVLDPLEMHETQVYKSLIEDSPFDFFDHAADGFTYDSGWKSVGPAPHPNCPAHNPSGCLYSSIDDMGLWLQYHMGITTPSTVHGTARDLIRGGFYNQPGDYWYTEVGFTWDFTLGVSCPAIPGSSGYYNIISKGGSVTTQQAYIAYLQNPSSPLGVSPLGVVLLINREPRNTSFSKEALGYDLLQKLPM
jgi:CubicO group peptidase (beta-lactamase class C family)